MPSLEKVFGCRASTKSEDGLPYKYGIRHMDDDWSKPATVEHHVVVNRYCNLFTAAALEFPDNQNWAVLNKEQKQALQSAVEKKSEKRTKSSPDAANKNHAV